jgi:hypothetical protein
MSMKLMITAAAIVAALAEPALAGNHGNDARARAVRFLHQTDARASVERAPDADPRGPYASPPDMAGYPTEYLMNRFGDRQLQGR